MDFESPDEIERNYGKRQPNQPKKEILDSTPKKTPKFDDVM